MIRTSDGQSVDISGEIWQWRVRADGGQLYTANWARIRTWNTVSVSFLDAARAFVAWRLQRVAPATAHGDFEAIGRLVAWVARLNPAVLVDVGEHGFSWEDYDVDIASLFLAWSRAHSASKGNDFIRIRTLYEWGVGLERPGFEAQTFQELQMIVARGNDKGNQVRSLDPEAGSFDEAEMGVLATALYGGQGEAQDRAIVLLHFELGPNPNATVRLLNGDLHLEPDGYRLALPRVKRTFPGRSTREVPISQALGDLLNSIRQGSPEDKLFGWLPDRNPEDALRYAMRRWVAQTQLVSPRTNAPLILYPRRLRYSLATLQMALGATLEEVAATLDHSDTQHVLVYVGQTAWLAATIGDRFDEVYSPFAALLLRRPVVSASGPLIPAYCADVLMSPDDMAPVGVCSLDLAKEGQCSLYPPLSCYSCPKFAPLKDDPHTVLLEAVQKTLNAYEDVLDEYVRKRLLVGQEAISILLRLLARQLHTTSGCREE